MPKAILSITKWNWFEFIGPKYLTDSRHTFSFSLHFFHIWQESNAYFPDKLKLIREESRFCIHTLLWFISTKKNLSSFLKCRGYLTMTYHLISQWLIFSQIFSFYLSEFSYKVIEEGSIIILLYHFHPHQTFSYSFITLYLRWILRIFNCIALFYRILQFDSKSFHDVLFNTIWCYNFSLHNISYHDFSLNRRPYRNLFLDSISYQNIFAFFTCEWKFMIGDAIYPKFVIGYPIKRNVKIKSIIECKVYSFKKFIASSVLESDWYIW